MIHKVGDHFCIASRQMWRPGVYDSERTARWAFRFKDEVLSRLQDEANDRNGGTGGVITREDLERAREESI